MRNNLLLGVVLITFGLFFLLDNLGFADFGELIQDYWPLLIIVWGLSILIRRRPATMPQPADGRPAAEGIPALDKEAFSESTVFGHLFSSISSQAFKGGSISTVFGDCEVDLTKATFAEGEHSLRVHGVFGNTNIILPKECAVSVTASSLFGTLTLLGQHKSGVATDMTMSSPTYASSSNRMRIHVNRVFGDVRIG